MLSVILCTHNPRTDFLERTLTSLAGQTLPRERWELLIVDNTSDPPIEARLAELGVDLPHRIVREETLGLTRARLRGFSESQAAVLVLVDDDNLLEPEYLQVAADLMCDEPSVGAAGGIVEGSFEVEPGVWARPYVDLLGVRDFGERPMRALVHGVAGPWEPIGAGMVVRREVALRYLELAGDPARLALDRIGASLDSCGDTDLARCASDLGLYLAYDPRLRLRHLIPRERTTLRYMVKLCRALKRSSTTLDRLRQRPPRLTRLQAAARLPLIPLRTVCASPRLWLLRMASAIGDLEGRTRRLSVD